VPQSVISEAMLAAVGREVRRAVSFPISESDIRRWAVAVYYPEPPPSPYWDVEAAALTVHKGIVAPEEFNPFAWMHADGPKPAATDGNDPDRVEKQLGVPPPGLPNQLNGGLEVTYGVRMRPGDVITSVTRLGRYTERTGRLGLMLMTPLEDTWTNQRDELVKRSCMTIIRY
jgi:N-terminal half of MaoC dehydratase